ncbi:Hypothetical predicted protein [Olea europaea subsp. europaea]|uniref:DUF1985 domain-containing protein n=1 Tax=Olea europaea subsp. europaea TaxID=158383 RepID=A0A8S0QLH8_OLEEU|nr:Hypothetical predicted protein [Olea europaea subsp. europaea]
MDFEFLIPEDAQLRAHISQRSNLKYVKIVMDHFDERQHEDFRNSPLGYLADIPNIQFSAQLILQLLFRTIRTEKVNELWFNVQGHLMRFDLQEYAVVTGLRCSIFPEGDDFDRLIERKRLKERYFKSNDKVSLAQLQSTVAQPSTTSLQENSKRLRGGRRKRLHARFTASPSPCKFGRSRRFRRLGNALVSESVNDCHKFFAGSLESSHNILHVYATLQPTDAEAE